jgi:hypothetical protein
VCDLATFSCVQCTPGSALGCQGATPICDPGSSKCAPCDGDHGGGSASACASSEAPFCHLGGAEQGACGRCAADADCAGHPAGPICDLARGACGTACSADADCAAGSFCDAPAFEAGTCAPRLSNGVALPAWAGACSAAIAARVCASAACDPADDRCGYANADGPCHDDAECRSGACDLTDQRCGLMPGHGPCAGADACRNGSACDVSTGVCPVPAPASGCASDEACAAGEFCSAAHACAPKRADGAACDRHAACASGACHDQLCDVVAGGGAGPLCSASGTPAPRAPAALLGLLLAAGLLRRRVAPYRRR